MKILIFDRQPELPQGDSSGKQKTNGEITEIPVTHLCWNCGNRLTVYEETDVPIPAKTVWNICPGCIKKAKK